MQTKKTFWEAIAGLIWFYGAPSLSRLFPDWKAQILGDTMDEHGPSNSRHHKATSSNLGCEKTFFAPTSGGIWWGGLPFLQMFSVRNLDFWCETPKVYLWMVYLTLPGIISLRHLRFLEEFRRGAVAEFLATPRLGQTEAFQPWALCFISGLRIPSLQLYHVVSLRSNAHKGFWRSGCQLRPPFCSYKPSENVKTLQKKWLGPKNHLQNDSLKGNHTKI